MEPVINTLPHDLIGFLLCNGKTWIPQNKPDEAECTDITQNKEVLSNGEVISYLIKLSC